MSAVQQRSLLRSGALSARELLQNSLERIDQVNPVLNAIVTLDPEGAYRQAAAADDAFARGAELPPLHGLVMAHKDLLATAGMRTTWGCRLFADHVPEADAHAAARMAAAGAVRIGKTNVPEFGLGSHTVNPVFGSTGNPYAPDRSAGGSSGERPPRWRRGCSASPTAATWVARCAIRRPSATSSACVRPWDG